MNAPSVPGPLPGALVERVRAWRTMYHALNHPLTSEQERRLQRTWPTEAERDACEAGMCSEYNEWLRAASAAQ